MTHEIEITVPLTAHVAHYRRGNRRKGEADELDYDLTMPSGLKVDSRDLGCDDEDIDSLVWEQIDAAERESAA